jgi:hypothetical protein
MVSVAAQLGSRPKNGQHTGRRFVSRLPFHGFVSRKKRSNHEDDESLVPILPRVEAAARAGQSCRCAPAHTRPRVAPRAASFT